MLSCKRNFSPEIFRDHTSGNPPKTGTQKINFLNGSSLGDRFFYIDRYLRDVYFDLVWGYHPPRNPPNGPPKDQFLNSLKLRCQFFLLYQQILNAHSLKRALLRESTFANLRLCHLRRLPTFASGC